MKLGATFKPSEKTTFAHHAYVLQEVIAPQVIAVHHLPGLKSEGSRVKRYHKGSTIYYIPYIVIQDSFYISFPSYNGNTF